MRFLKPPNFIPILLFFSLFVIAPDNSRATQVSIASYADENPGIYKGQIFNLNFILPDLNSRIRSSRIGVSALSGKYESGEKANNEALSIGTTIAFENFYIEWDSEFANHGTRKPLASHLLQGFLSYGSLEFGLGYRTSQFKAPVEDFRSVLLTSRYFYSDREFLGATAYISTDQPDLKSYSLYIRNYWGHLIETNLRGSWGRSQEDIGVTQDFRSVSFNLMASIRPNIKIGVEDSKTWGSRIDTNYKGLVLVWMY